MRILLAICALGMTAVPSGADARHRQEAKVRYETSEGRSKWYAVEVIFMTGSELAQATKSFRYDSFKNYAVIFWGDEEASVIKLTQPSFMLCGSEFDKNCLPVLGNMKGPDQQGRAWEICTGTICY